MSGVTFDVREQNDNISLDIKEQRDIVFGEYTAIIQAISPTAIVEELDDVYKITITDVHGTTEADIPKMTDELFKEFIERYLEEYPIDIADVVQNKEEYFIIDCGSSTEII